MWHEARKQEKLIRSKLVDSAKRHERRQAFYAQIRKDPEQFMQIHGRKSKIHIDPAVANAAEASNILRKWQGDPTVLIDRFDARAHLDYIPEASTRPDKQKTLREDVEELQCDYERYRILVLNEFQKIPEKDFLKQISTKEFWHAQPSHLHKLELEKKKKAAEKKAAIGFSYNDSETVPGRGKFQKKGDSSESESEDEIDEPEEFDLKFDVDGLSAEKGAEMNRVATQYNVGSGTFLKLLRIDRKEQDDNEQIKEIDKAKLALSGRQAKADRALLKKRRALIVGKVAHNEDATTTLLSFLAHTKGDVGQNSSSSSGESDGEVEKTEFITSFGEETTKSGQKHSDDDNETGDGRVVQGPVLPTKEYRRLLELKHRRSASPDFGEKHTSTAQRRPSAWSRRSRSRSRDRRRRSRERRRSRSRSRSRSRNRRDRSRSRHRRSRSRSTSRRRRTETSRRHRSRTPSRRERSRSRNRSPARHTRRRSSSSESASRRSPKRAAKPRSRSASPVPTASRSRRSPSSSRASSGRSGDDSPLSLHSSMSDSERERIEIENRKRRVRRTKRELKRGHKRQSSSSDEESGKKSLAAKKLRLQVQKAIKKTAQELKAEEEEKAREQLRERMQRDEEDARMRRRNSRSRERSYDDSERRRHRRRRSSSSD